MLEEPGLSVLGRSLGALFTVRIWTHINHVCFAVVSYRLQQQKDQDFDILPPPLICTPYMSMKVSELGALHEKYQQLMEGSLS